MTRPRGPSTHRRSRPACLRRIVYMGSGGMNHECIRVVIESVARVWHLTQHSRPRTAHVERRGPVTRFDKPDGLHQRTGVVSCSLSRRPGSTRIPRPSRREPSLARLRREDEARPRRAGTSRGIRSHLSRARAPSETPKLEVRPQRRPRRPASDDARRTVILAFLGTHPHDLDLASCID